MRLEGAFYGGEMSAHHYFRDFAYCDIGMIPWLLVGEMISNSGNTLSYTVEMRMNKFPCSGEINYQVDDLETTIKRVYEHYNLQALNISYTDGLIMEFSDWRYNLRSSNTESLLRLNVETRRNRLILKQYVLEIESF